MKRIIILISLLAFFATANSTTIKVSSLDDNGPGTLREALFRADTSLFTPFQVDTILVSVTGTIMLDSSLKVIPAIVVQGIDADEVKIDGSNFDGPILNFVAPGGQEPCLECEPIFPNRPLNSFGSTVRDLTLQNGYSSDRGGAGLVGFSLYVTFTNVNFLNNRAELHGGAVSLEDDATADFDSCYFFNNSSVQGIGGAIASNYYGYVTIKNTILENNTSKTLGGAIYAFEGGDLTIEKSVFLNNESDEGGALGLESAYSYNNITETTFEGNKSLVSGGGAVYLKTFNIDLTINNSSFISNSANTEGGAIACNMGSNTTVVNSTFSGNGALTQGGAVSYYDGQFSMKFVTITENTSPYGAGISVGGLANTTIENTVISGNNGSADAIYDIGESGFSSNGYSFIGATDAFITPVTGDNFGSTSAPIDAMLGPLADNGGVTLTHEPLAGSPLINQIPGSSVPEANDQRNGIYVRVNDTDADIGAVEYQCDHIVDLLTDGTECGTLREAIEYANTNPGEDLIAFNLPSGSTITLMDSLLIIDRVLLHAHVYDFNLQRITDSSRIGIQAGTPGINGLVFAGVGTANSEVVNFNFQGFEDAAISIRGTYGIAVGASTFGTTLADETVAGIPNNIGVQTIGAGEIELGEKSWGNGPLAFKDNYFIGNTVGVDFSGLGDDQNVFFKDVFSCNGTAVVSPVSAPVIDTIFQGYIKGTASPNSIVTIFGDSTCNKDQATLYVGNLIADGNGVFESYAFNFDSTFMYVANAVEDYGEGYSSTSPFSAAQKVLPCDSIDKIPDLEICGDSLVYVTSGIPVGYTFGANDLQETSRTKVEGDSVVITGLIDDTTYFDVEVYNGKSCAYYDNFFVVKYDSASDASLFSIFIPQICEDSLMVSATTPTVGEGAWSSSGALTFDDTSSASTTMRGLMPGDSLYFFWTVTNGICPAKVDSLLIERGEVFTPVADLVQISNPACARDSIAFSASLNYPYDANDIVDWYINGVRQVNEFDTVFTARNWGLTDTVDAVYSSMAMYGDVCPTKSADTARVILALPQKSLTAMDDSVAILIHETINVDVLDNDIVEHQNFSGISFAGSELYATILNDSTISYDGQVPGVDTVEFYVFGSCTEVDTAILIVNVINTAPIGKDTTIAVLSGESVALDMIDVFTDAENNFDPLSAVITSQTTSLGAFNIVTGTLNADYTNSPTYTGTDTLIIDVSDDVAALGSVQIIFVVSDTVTARAGDDQTISDTITTLAANAAAGYTTFWTTPSSQLVFADDTDPLTQVYGFTPDNSPYELVWNISNGVKVERDTLVVTVVNTNPYGSDLAIIMKPGRDTSIYVGGVFADDETNIKSGLMINSFSNPSGLYSLSNDSLIVSYDAIPLYLGVDTVVLAVEDVFGATGSINVSITVTDKVIADAGTDMTIDTSYTMLGATPVGLGRTGVWTSLNASVVIDDPSDALTGVNNLLPQENNEPYLFIWTVSNGQSTDSDTVAIYVENVAPELEEELVVELPQEQQAIVVPIKEVTDRNNNFFKKINIIRPFGKLLGEGVYEIDLNQNKVLVNIDASTVKYEPHEEIIDTMIFEVCDASNACSQSVVSVFRKGTLQLDTENLTDEVGLGTSFNFLSPNGDGVNDYFVFNLDINGKDMKLAQIKEGQLVTGENFFDVFTYYIDHIELTIFNRWGDLIHDEKKYDNYFGGQDLVSGMDEGDRDYPIDNGFAWDGKDQNGENVTPGTYFFYIIVHKKKGDAEVKLKGFIEVRN